MKTLHLFADSNVFIQCRPLELLTWTQWSDFDEIRIVVCRPIQREIDQLKSRGADRVGKKARAASARIRDLILSDAPFAVVRAAKPAVHFYLDSTTPPTPGLGDLDYEEYDNALVGTVHEFRSHHVGDDARVLTDDTGPMMSAKAVGVPFDPVPADWLLEPEKTAEEKRIAALESRLAKLETTGPSFEILCEDLTGTPVREIAPTIVRYAPLTENEVAELMLLLRTRVPMVKNLPQPPESQIRGVPWVGPIPSTYIPATMTEVIAYQTNFYPAWLSKCERFFQGFHTELAGASWHPGFQFAVRNKGSRPGEHVLVEFEVSGAFKIMPRPDEAMIEKLRSKIAIPDPPLVPRGRWSEHPMAKLANLAEGRPLLDAALLSDPYKFDQRRDPNGLYWKPRRPSAPTKSYALECEQWRHETAPEVIASDLYKQRDDDDVSGVVECRIHAANLSSPISLRVPVRIATQTGSAFGSARALIDALTAP